MERDFKRPVEGDVYAIKKQYDHHGWPAIRVLSVDARRHRMRVQDIRLDGTHGGPLDRGPRDFNDDRGWPKLRKHWKRHECQAEYPATAEDLFAKATGNG